LRRRQLGFVGDDLVNVHVLVPTGTWPQVEVVAGLHITTLSRRDDGREARRSLVLLLAEEAPVALPG
jgi:hypothetical protein